MKEFLQSVASLLMAAAIVGMGVAISLYAPKSEVRVLELRVEILEKKLKIMELERRLEK